MGARQNAPLTRLGPRPLPIGGSLLAHGGLLALVALGPPRAVQQRSLYDLVIKPQEQKLVWYSFREKLPEVAPPENSDSAKAAAQVKMPDQSIVSHPRDAQPGTQLIWRPVPQIKPQPAVPSPNLLALRLPQIAPPPVPPAKRFVPPEAQHPKPREPAPALPEAPKLQARMEARLNAPVLPNVAAALENRPKSREFVPPASRPVPRTASPVLPEAPRVATALKSERVPLLAEDTAAALANKPRLRTFLLPAQRGRPSIGVAALPEAPAVLAGSANAGGARTPVFDDSASAALSNKPRPRAFVPPPVRPGGGGRNGALVAAAVEDAPRLNVAATPLATLNMAVVGLNPADKLTGPLPELSRSARFSAGPEVNGSSGSGQTAASAPLAISGLTIRNKSGQPGAPSVNPILVARAAPTLQETLEAAAKLASRSVPQKPSSPPEIHLAPPPDPRFIGREVYTLAVQMPNISSYVGSWIMWFAERVPAGIRGGHDLRPPDPTHKVDPKYYPAAIAERIEGKVQLAGIIRADGRVDSVRVLKGVDPRLDGSAAEALMKWVFEPARKDGVPVEVDVVAEIPFRLAPPVRK